MNTQGQSATANLRMLFGLNHNYLEGTVEGVTAEQARWQPGGKTTSIEAHYVHIAAGEDFLVNVLARGAAPLMATSYAGRTGFAGQPPIYGWDKWTENAQIDLPAVRAYAQAVYAATDSYLAGLSDEALSQPVDLSILGMGIQTVAVTIGLALGNCAWHTGELSCVKGLQGLTGYPVSQPQQAAEPA